MNNQIENNFKYHAPKEGQQEKYEAIRNKAKELTYLIDEACPGSREKSLAMTKLEESVMWANASIARNCDICECYCGDYKLTDDEIDHFNEQHEKWVKTNKIKI